MGIEARNLEAMSLFSILEPTTVTAANETTGINLTAIDGDALFLLSATASAASTSMRVKVQHSATQGGTYADVADGAFVDLGSTAGAQKLAIPRSDGNGWYRLAFHTETGTFSASVSCVAIGLQRFM